MMFIHLQFLF